MTAEEKQAVYYVVCSIQMICAAYFESINEYKDLAKINREMLLYIIKQKNRIKKISASYNFIILGANFLFTVQRPVTQPLPPVCSANL